MSSLLSFVHLFYDQIVFRKVFAEMWEHVITLTKTERLENRRSNRSLDLPNQVLRLEILHSPLVTDLVVFFWAECNLFSHVASEQLDLKSRFYTTSWPKNSIWIIIFQGFRAFSIFPLHNCIAAIYSPPKKSNCAYLYIHISLLILFIPHNYHWYVALWGAKAGRHDEVVLFYSFTSLVFMA